MICYAGIICEQNLMLCYEFDHLLRKVKLMKMTSLLTNLEEQPNPLRKTIKKRVRVSCPLHTVQTLRGQQILSPANTDTQTQKVLLVVANPRLKPMQN